MAKPKIVYFVDRANHVIPVGENIAVIWEKRGNGVICSTAAEAHAKVGASAQAAPARQATVKNSPSRPERADDR